MPSINRERTTAWSVHGVYHPLHTGVLRARHILCEENRAGNRTGGSNEGLCTRPIDWVREIKVGNRTGVVYAPHRLGEGNRTGTSNGSCEGPVAMGVGEGVLPSESCRATATF